MAEKACVRAVAEAHARACSRKMAGVERAGRCSVPGDSATQASGTHSLRRRLEDDARTRAVSALT